MERKKPFLEMTKRHQRRILAAVFASDNSASSSAADDINKLPNEGRDAEGNNIVDEEQAMILSERSSNSSDDSEEEEEHEQEAQEELEEQEEDVADIREDDMDLDDVDGNIGQEETLADKIAYWALLFGISHVALAALLLILRFFFPAAQLPKDARTLLGTPRKTIIRSVEPGNYFHYGLLRGIVDELNKHSNHAGIHNCSISIDIGIDGLPLAKSSKSQLWPILGSVKTTIANWKPFVIGLYHGYAKPTSVNAYLDEFITECEQLIENGFYYRGKQYKVNINAVICDTPARSYVKCIKGHTGYFGCGLCIQEGEYKHNRLLFTNFESPVRTDDNFRRREYEEHHIGNSPFERIPLNMVTQFPLDYMHLCCLGIMKKLIKMWMHGEPGQRNRSFQLGRARREELSALLVALSSWIPEQFQRKSRDLNELPNWKATEFRLFLLYLGPVVLRRILPRKLYIHFNAFNKAMRILCHPTDCHINNHTARDLLQYFVEKFKQFYGERHLIYNVHNLLHLADAASIFGSLDSISAFAFENFMQKLKKMLRKHQHPLQQYHRRLSEGRGKFILHEDNVQFPHMSNPRRDQNLPFLCTRPHEKLNFSDFTLDLRKSNNCCYIRDGTIIIIQHFAYLNDERVVIGQGFRNKVSIQDYPGDSADLNIFCVSNLSGVRVWPVEHIDQKAFRIPIGDEFIVMPLLHCSHQQ